MENMQVMIILFAIVILGYVISKLGYMNEAFDRKLSSIVIDITCPLLVLASTMGRELPDRSLILPLLGIGTLTYLLLTVVALYVPRLISKNTDNQGIYGFAMMYGNVGFIGYPVVASIFGPKAVFYAAILNIPNTLTVFTIGVLLIKGSHRLRDFNPRILFTPAMIASYLAIIIVALRIANMPKFITEPITLVGNITVPVSLLVIGSSISRLSLRKMMGSPAIYVTAAIRLMIIPVSFYFIFITLGFNPQVVAINTVLIAMPVASFGTMFTLKYGRDASLMTELTFVSTAAAMISIPLITLLFK